MSEFAKDYVDVAERIRLLREKHPGASLRGSYELVVVNDVTHVVYRAECYRSSDDPTPGIGYAWEQVPGRTPFTRGSELMNAETSAWGRAIVASLAADAKNVASEDEVIAATPAVQDVPTRPVAAKERIKALEGDIRANGQESWVKDQGFAWPWSDDDCDRIVKHLAQLEIPF